MSVILFPGDFVTQHQDDVVRYDLPATSWDVSTPVTVSAIRPNTMGGLTAEAVAPGQVRVQGGVAGARYEVSLGEQAFQVRVWIEGFKVEAGGLPLERGKVLIRRRDGTYELAWAQNA